MKKINFFSAGRSAKVRQEKSSFMLENSFNKLQYITNIFIKLAENSSLHKQAKPVHWEEFFSAVVEKWGSLLLDDEERTQLATYVKNAVSTLEEKCSPLPLFVQAEGSEEGPVSSKLQSGHIFNHFLENLIHVPESITQDKRLKKKISKRHLAHVTKYSFVKKDF